MKKLLWTSAMALTAAACMTACDDSSSGASNSIPEFKTEAALPDTCEMEVAKAGDTYFACFENKWIEVTDSATVEQLKEGLDEDEVKAKLEELEDLLKPATPAKPKSSSSKNTDEDVDSSDSEEPESSASEEECTGRRCKTGNSSSSKKSSGGSGSGDSGEGGEGGEGGDSSPSSATSGGSSSSSTESSPSSATSSDVVIYPECDGVRYDPAFHDCNSSDEIVLKEGVIEVTTKWLNQTMLANGDYGFLFDWRDKQLYRTVKIGNQTWMAQNLNFTTEKSKCAYNAEGCDKYGRLYLWTDALHLSDDCNSESVACAEPHEGVQGVCPDGWHVPTQTEAEAMINSNVVPSLISTEMEESQIAGGSGYTNSTGLSLIPVGRYGASSYEAMNTQLNSLLSTEGIYENSRTHATYYVAKLLFANTSSTYGNEGIGIYGSNNFKGYYLSLRCIKDAE